MHPLYTHVIIPDQGGGAAVPVSKAQMKAVAKWQKENYDVVKMKVPKGEKADIKAHAEAHGESMNAFVLRSVRETMARDKEETREE